MSLLKSLSEANIRECPVELTVAGETIKATVRYRSSSIKDGRAQREMIKRKEDAEETVYYSDLLENKVESLIEADGTVIELTLDLLESMAVENLKAIFDAVHGHTDPKPQTQN